MKKVYYQYAKPSKEALENKRFKLYLDDVEDGIKAYNDHNGYQRTTIPTNADKIIVVSNIGINDDDRKVIQKAIGEKQDKVEVIYFDKIAKNHSFEKFAESTRDHITEVVEKLKDLWFIEKLIANLKRDQEQLSTTPLKVKTENFFKAYGLSEYHSVARDFLNQFGIKYKKEDLDGLKQQLKEKIKLRKHNKRFVEDGMAYIHSREKIRQHEEAELKAKIKQLQEQGKLESKIFSETELDPSSTQFAKMVANLNSAGVQAMIKEEALLTNAENRDLVKQMRQENTKDKDYEL